ncbi:MAG: DUF115 domain-containing protein [Treponema sp.]|nr:DUF115 domain-containing protein [Treponema sp.]
MDKSYFFDRNLLALSQRDPELCSRLTGAQTTLNRYRFLESRSGEVIPAWVAPQGSAHPLHSTIDPRKEARRLIDSMESEGFLALLGLGGGYYAEAALERADVGMALVIEYDIDGLAELLCNRDYAALFGDPRFRLVVDVCGKDLENCILALYQPVLYGGIRVIPLRSRTTGQAERFALAGDAISAAIDKVSADYSVQAHFGRRWFSNIIRNIEAAGKFQNALPPIRRAAVCAAGPSLSLHLPQLRRRRGEFFLIAADTSLPCLLSAEIKPDAVISIDCQHISYHHFMDGLPDDVFLFMDLASPPLLASLSARNQFFCGGHPLARYVSRIYRPLPELDTSGGNVAYAAVSLAAQLGAAEIELYGADFSYPAGICYARGTYIYSVFASRQTRFAPLEAQNSAFLFRAPLEKKRRPDDGAWYYETKALQFYRQRLEEKSGIMEAGIIPAASLGAPVTLAPRGNARRRELKIFSSGKPAMGSAEFLRFYRDEIAALGEPGRNAAQYFASLKGEALAVFATILPAAAAIKQRRPQADFRELFTETREHCLSEISLLLGAKPFRPA